MKLSEVAIGRPVLASMMSAALVLFGVIGYTRLSVRELPDIDPPIISVSTTLPGAKRAGRRNRGHRRARGGALHDPGTAHAVELLVGGEQSDHPGVQPRPAGRHRRAGRARQGVAGTGRLPVDVLEPVIAKQQADAQPFFWLALSSPNYDLMQLSDVADRLVKARLQSLAGVGSAGVFGERRFAMRVWIQPDQLSARGLTVQDVESAIAARNVEIPAGRIESTRREFSVRSLGELKNPREFGELVVTSQAGRSSSSRMWRTSSSRPRTLARSSATMQIPRSPSAWSGSPKRT